MGEDCWGGCGEMPGWCTDFCGDWGMCCKKGDDGDPEECKAPGVHFEERWHHQCVELVTEEERKKWAKKREEREEKRRLAAYGHDYEEGGNIGYLLRLDPIQHGWNYATGFVRQSDARLVKTPWGIAKPESQHARKFGRASANRSRCSFQSSLL